MTGERRQKIAVAVVFVAAMFINIIDATVVNVALPTIARDFGVPVESTASINIGFLVAVAVAIPVAGWLGDRFGPRGIFIGALCAFTTASAACGLAPSVELLVIFRVLQGLGGGLMTPVGLTMLFRTFPPNERVRLARITNVPIAFAPALGPVVGGFLVQHVDWRWIFGINVPVGLLAVAFTVSRVRPLARAARTRLDIIGFVLAGLGFALLMFAVSEGATRGWGTAPILVPGLVGLALLMVLARTELRLPAPLLQLRLYRLRLFRTTSLITMASAAGFLGALFAYPLMLQTSFGYEPLEAGLLTFPEAVGIVIGTQVVGRFYSGLGPRRLIVTGQSVVGLVLLTIAAISSERVPPAVLVTLMVVLGIGQSSTFVPTQAAAFDTVPRDQIGAGTTLYNATRQAGSAIGVAIAATVIAAIGVSAGPAADPTPFRWALVACAVCNVVGIICALTIDDDDAAPSRGR